MKKFSFALFLLPIHALPQSLEAETAERILLIENAFHWPLLLLALGFAAAVIRLARRMTDIHPALLESTARLAAEHPEFDRIGGWLIFPTLALIVKAALGILNSLILGYSALQMAFWNLFQNLNTTEPGNVTDSLVLAVLMQSLWSACFLPVLLGEFFRRKASVPAMVLVYTFTNLAFSLGLILLYLLANPDPTGYNTGYMLGQFAVVLVLNLVWLLYFLKSRRVRVYFRL